MAPHPALSPQAGRGRTASSADPLDSYARRFSRVPSPRLRGEGQGEGLSSASVRASEAGSTTRCAMRSRRARCPASSRWRRAIAVSIYEGAFGMRDLDAGGTMTLDTVFRIASMTKAITSVAAMQLVEQGKIGLDDPVPDIDPALDPAAGAGRVRCRRPAEVAAGQAPDHLAPSADPHRRLHL